MGDIFGLGSFQNRLAAQEANSMTKKENQKDRDFNSLEAEKQRNWQSQEWQRQYDQQRTEWYNQLAAQQEAQRAQFDYEAEYNSPVNQLKRLNAIGLNASAMVNQSGQSGLVSAATGNISAAPSPAPPSGGSVSGSAAASGSGRGFIAPSVSFGSIAEVGQFARDMSEASKTNKSLQLILDNLSADLLGKKLSNDALEIQNWISKNTKGSKVQQAFADLQNTMSEVSYRLKLGENVDADTLLKQSERFLSDAKKHLTDEQYEYLKLQVDTFMDNFAMEMAVRKSQVRANEASSARDYAVAATENQLREFRVANQKLVNDFQASENRLKSNEATLSDLLLDSNYQTQLKELSNRALQSDILTEQHKEALTRALKENRYYEVRQLLLPVIGQINSVSSAATNVVK